jgi:hypothetical protein
MSKLRQLDSISEVDLNNGGGLRSLNADDDLLINSSSCLRQTNFTAKEGK